jgi:hypothetical protein
VAVVLSLLAAAPDQEGAGDSVELQGHVTDAGGRPVSEVLVYAVERGASRILAAARPDPDGLFQLKLAPRVHDFGIMSSRWMIGGSSGPRRPRSSWW